MIQFNLKFHLAVRTAGKHDNDPEINAIVNRAAAAADEMKAAGMLHIDPCILADVVRSMEDMRDTVRRATALRRAIERRAREADDGDADE